MQCLCLQWFIDISNAHQIGWKAITGQVSFGSHLKREGCQVAVKMTKGQKKPDESISSSTIG